MPKTKISPLRQKRRLGLVALAPLMALSSAHAATTVLPISATAKYDSASDKVVVSGKTLSSITAGAKISVFDVSNNTILYTVNTDKKNSFNMQLLGATSVPCVVRIEATNPKDNSQSQVVLPVSGAKSCSTLPPMCSITKPAMDTEITVGSSLTFESAKVKGDSVWSINDGSADVNQATVNHVFDGVGKYRVTLKVTDGANQCIDDMMVSVIPPKGTNPNGKVKEQIAPSLANAMPKVDKKGNVTNDENALVVLPYEDMGMQGGSQISLPFNPMINYNTLNTQVIQKAAHKPKLLDDSEMEVRYSAGSNPKDPAGKDSINSTSQNLFDKNHVGTNYDPNTSKLDPATGKPLKNVFIDGQDYHQAKIRKSEQWDRIHQPLAKEQGIDETGMAFTDQQNRYMPAFMPALPDQGVRGNADKAIDMREMPGIANPYIANEPKKFAYSPDKQNFAAQFIPASDIDDQGRTNPYPIMRVEAKVNGKTAAKTDAVYTTASETRCRECHAAGKIAGDEDVWRMPVTTDELVAPDGKPGAATGAGSYDPGTDPTKPWPPAIHNKFDDKIAGNDKFTNLAPQVNDSKSVVYIPRDQNGLRTDRVKESRWVKVDSKGKPTSETSPTKPANADANWKLQVRLNFREPQEEGGTTWVEQEKAALFNTLVMHDYMVYFGPTPATGALWPASYSTQLADSYADDKGKSRAQPMYFCSGHHQSALKFDVGVVPRAFQTNRSDYSKAFHAFHGKMQVYKTDVAASDSADGLAHKKGDLIRDERGHPKMFGGRGWDSQHNDDNGVPLTADANGTLTTPTKQAYDIKKNNWRPDLFPADKNGEPLVKTGDKIPVEENCVKCHTGATEKSYRDVHHTAGLKCDSCHGDMLAVGNVYENKKYNMNLTGGGAYTADSINYRRPWLDEPNCGSCHMGDGNMGKDGKGDAFSAGVMRTAWNADDKSGYSRDPMNARFAVMPVKEMRLEPKTGDDKSKPSTMVEDKTKPVDSVTGKYPMKETWPQKTDYVPQPVSTTLYRKSADVHGSGANGALNCSACHGGSHALWPNQDPNANDNQTSKQLQGYDGNIAECSVCHIKDDFKDGLVATDGGASGLGVAQGVRDGTVVNATSPKAFLAGPHGMHPVGDKSWYYDAKGAAKNTAKTQNGKFNGGWHNDFASKPGPDGEDQCAACHGADHKGTRLSKSLVDRTLTDAMGKEIKVAKGQIIGCDLCHKIEKSFMNSPKGVAKNHPAPQAESFVIGGKPAATGTTTGSMGGMSGMTMSH